MTLRLFEFRLTWEKEIERDCSLLGDVMLCIKDQ